MNFKLLLCAIFGHILSSRRVETHNDAYGTLKITEDKCSRCELSQVKREIITNQKLSRI